MHLLLFLKDKIEEISGGITAFLLTVFSDSLTFLGIPSMLINAPLFDSIMHELLKSIFVGVNTVIGVLIGHLIKKRLGKK